MMDRLTKTGPIMSAWFMRDNAPIATLHMTEIETQRVLDRLAAYEDTGLMPEAINGLVKSFLGTLAGEIAEQTGSADMSRIHEIADAESDGRLIVLPCKVGDTVYVPVERCKPGFNVCPYDGGYGTFRCDGDKNCGAYVKEHGFSIRDYPDVGKTVFLTREEAEAALKEAHNGE